MAVTKKVLRKSRKKTSKKTSKKKTKRQKVKEIKPINLTPAPYNPRSMSDKAKSGLNESMKEFNDISGITWNQTTGNIITGHHRWEGIVSEYGLEDLVFTHLKNDKYLIETKDGTDTGYILRVVKWSLSKEKAANVTANSPKIGGVFTVDLKAVLEDIKIELDDSLFSELRLDELNITTNDISSNSSEDGEWETDIDAVENVESNLDGIITTIKIECAQDARSELFVLLSEFIEQSGWAGKVQIK